MAQKKAKKASWRGRGPQRRVQGPTANTPSRQSVRVAQEGLTGLSCPRSARWTATNCLGFQLPSCLKARPYLVI